MRIEPRDDETQPIQIKIEHFPFHHQLEYVALSYTWGSESPTYDIYIYGDEAAEGSFTVRQNLRDFLREMRRHRDESWFWIDQICINQNDQEEKSWQVRQMSDIYSEARDVIVWLGPSFEGSDALMDRATFDAAGSASDIRKACEAYIVHGPRHEETEERRTSHEINHDDPSAFRHERRLSMSSDQIAWENLRRATARRMSLPDQTIRRKEVEGFWKQHQFACRRVLSLPYFKRTWIIQEVRLSHNPIVHLGSRSAQWKHLMSVLSYVQNPEDRRFGSFSGRELKRIEGLGHLFTLDFFDDTETPDWTYTWYDMLYLVVSSQCTDGRDKAYAMLGLLPEHLRMQPDYGLEDLEIVFQITRKQITATLDILEWNCLETNHPQRYFKYDRRRWLNRLTVINLVESFKAAVCTSIWYYEMHQGGQQGYEPERIRSFLLNEVFPAFRKQRMAQGSEWGYHGWTERVIARVLAPREKGFVFWCYRRIFPELSKIRMRPVRLEKV